MCGRLLKANPAETDAVERDFDLEYYMSLDPATRFRMTIERSILLLRLARRDADSPSPPALTKRI
jgi:hypothetical protein